MNLKLITILILLMFIIIFTAQNYERVVIQFLFWSFETSRAIIIFSALFTGIMIGWLLAFTKKRGE